MEGRQKEWADDLQMAQWRRVLCHVLRRKGKGRGQTRRERKPFN